MLSALLLSAFWSARAFALGSLSTLPYDPGTTWDNPAGLAYFHRLDALGARTWSGDSESITLVLPAPGFNSQIFLDRDGQRWEYGLAAGKELTTWLAGGALLGYSHDSAEHRVPLSVGLCPSFPVAGLGRLAGGFSLVDLLGEPVTGLAASLVTGYSVPYLVILDFRKPWADSRWAMSAGLDCSLTVTSFADISGRVGYLDDPAAGIRALTWGAGLGLPFASLDLGARNLDAFMFSVDLFIK